MSKVSRCAVAIAVLISVTSMLTACRSEFEKRVSDLVATEPPSKVIENTESTSPPRGEDNPNRYVAPTESDDYTADIAQQRLLDYLGGSGSFTAEYKTIVTVKENDYPYSADYYVFEVKNSSDVIDKYYVTADRYGAGLYKSSDFYKRYFKGAKDVCTVEQAKYDLLTELSGIPDLTADYRSTVTEDDDIYSGKIVYYVFSVKQDGEYIEDYYVRATNFGGMVLSEMDFKSK